MTVVVIVNGTPKTIKMVETVMEHHRGGNGKSSIVILTRDRVHEYSRDVTIQIIEPGLNPHFYDQHEQRIEARWVGYVEKDGEIIQAPKLPMAKVTKVRRAPGVRGPKCMSCGGPADYEGEPCGSCARTL